MAKGVAAKGFKMTQNRKNILNLLIEEGGSLKSKEGKATSLLHGLVEHGGSLVSLNATLRELESLGFIEREVEGRRTYGISVTDKARDELGKPKETIKAKVAAAKTETEQASATVPETDFDWDDEQPQDTVPDGIDYDILLGVFLKAALRGMEGPSNGELEYYKQQNEQAMEKLTALEQEVIKLQADASSAIAERDQLQKNLNLIMSKAEQKTSRGSDPIRRLLSPEERGALDALMRQVPTRKGD